jgi:anti-anti-sigma factor
MPVLPEPRSRADKHLHQPAPDTSAASRRCRCAVATLSNPAGDIVVLRVAGEVDAASFAVLDAALDDVLDQRPDHLIVDLTGLVFCSSRGLTAIARSARAAAEDGTRYSMSGASPVFARLWPHYWPDGDAPRIHRTTAAAVLAALALQADLWNPPPATDLARTADVANEHDPDSPAADIRERVDDAPARHADPAALRQALQRHRSRMYRTALHALGASYGAHSLAPDLAAQLRTALAGFAATPPDGPGSPGTR